MKKSWKTTATGAAAVIASLATVAKFMLDGDPQTNPDWTLSMTSILSGIGLIFARDNNVSSEDVGLKK